MFVSRRISLSLRLCVNPVRGQIGDIIHEVNGHSLKGYTQAEAVELLRNTSQRVTLKVHDMLSSPIILFLLQ